MVMMIYFTGHEKESDLAEGIYTTEYRLYDARVGRWLSVDPLFEKYVGMSPYNYCMLNPVMMVDPDGRDIITTDENGIVVTVEEQKGLNVFKDFNGDILTFNDTEEADRDMLNRKFYIGDRVYMQLSSEDARNQIQSVSKNEEIKNSWYGGYIDIAEASHSEADFTFSYLLGYYDKNRNTESELSSNMQFERDLRGIRIRDRRTHIPENMVYFKFEGTEVLYNIYDSGNFMWGAWTKEIGLSDRMTWFGSELNEYGFDSNADQKAIKDGRSWYSTK